MAAHQPSLGAQRRAEGCRAVVRQDEGGHVRYLQPCAPSFGSAGQFRRKRWHEESRKEPFRINLRRSSASRSSFASSRSLITRARRFERRRCRWESCRECQFHGHVVQPEQQRVQTQNLAALGVQVPPCPPAFARSAVESRRLPRLSPTGLRRASLTCTACSELRLGKPFRGDWLQREQQTPAT